MDFSKYEAQMVESLREISKRFSDFSINENEFPLFTTSVFFDAAKADESTQMELFVVAVRFLPQSQVQWSGITKLFSYHKDYDDVWFNLRGVFEN